MLVVFKKATLAHTFKIYINLHVLSVLIPAASPSVCSLQPACEYKVWAESFTHWCNAQVDKFQLLTKIKAFEINSNHYNTFHLLTLINTVSSTVLAILSSKLLYFHFHISTHEQNFRIWNPRLYLSLSFSWYPHIKSFLHQTIFQSGTRKFQITHTDV